MKQIHIATLFLSLALLCLSQYYPCLSPLANLPDPAMAMPSSAVTFNTLCLLWVLRPRPRLQEHFHFFLVQGCHHTHWAQQDMSARGDGRADCHYPVQTVRQGRGSRGWSHWGSRGLASATRRTARSGSRQVLPYLYIAYDVKAYNVGVNRLSIPILTYDFVYHLRDRIIPM